MPRIREYTSQIRSPGPVESRRANTDDFGVGKAVAALGQGVSELGSTIRKREEQKELSSLNVKISESHAKLSQVWAERLATADPDDPELSENFMREYDDHMSEIESGINSAGAREYFNQSNAAMRMHFSERTFAGQADLAGVKAKQDHMSSLNNLSSSLISDPSSFELARGLHSAGVENLVKKGTLSRDVALQLKTQGEGELAKSALRGWIKMSPEYAEQQLDSGRWDAHFDGDTKAQMYGQVRIAKNGMEAEREHAQQLQRRAIEERQEVTKKAFLEKLTTGSLSPREILDSNLDSTQQEHFIRMVRTMGDENSVIRTDPHKFMNLWDRVHLPDNDPNKLRNEDELNGYLGRGLSLDGINQLRAEMQGKKTTQGGIEAELKKGMVEIARGSLTKSNALTGLRDPAGDEQMQKFMSFFLSEYAAQREQGKTALQLLSPDSPDYLGKHIQRFTRSQQQILQDLTGAPPVADPAPTPNISPNPTPSVGSGTGRIPGESAADFLKRTRK